MSALTQRQSIFNGLLSKKNVLNRDISMSSFTSNLHVQTQPMVKKATTYG